MPRAIISGFIATVAMSVLFFMAYGAAQIATHLELRPQRGAAEFTTWLHALTHNPVLDLAASSLYTAAAVHLVVGVLLAMAYAYYFERRLSGPSWGRGMLFSLIPWIISVVVFLPLVGGGFLGLGLGAGPLPAIGNLILHLGYGVVLGVVYGPLGDVPADDFSFSAPRDDELVMTEYEAAAARGIVVGAIVGVALGIVALVIESLQPEALALGVPPLAFIPVAAALGATFGGFIGSLGGLAAAPGHAVPR